MIPQKIMFCRDCRENKTRMINLLLQEPQYSNFKKIYIMFYWLAGKYILVGTSLAG